MKITRQQLADLLDGIGSAWISSGAFDDADQVILWGEELQRAAGLVREDPAEDYEVPPVREESV